MLVTQAHPCFYYYYYFFLLFISSVLNPRSHFKLQFELQRPRQTEVYTPFSRKVGSNKIHLKQKKQTKTFMTLIDFNDSLILNEKCNSAAQCN